MIADEVLRGAAYTFDQAMVDSVDTQNIPEYEFSDSFEMKMKKLCRKANWLAASKVLSTVATLVVICVCILSIGVGITHAAIQVNKMTQAGQYYAEVHDKTESGEKGKVLAVYNGHEVTAAVVEYQHKMNSLLFELRNETDLEVVNRIITGIMLAEEAERLGIAATQEEIDAFIENMHSAYQHPDGKEMIDDYCEGAGLTVEEYFKITDEQVPGMIARNKLRNKYHQEYCEENGIDCPPGTTTLEIQAAVETRIKEELFDKYKHNIQYFIDTEK